MKILFLWLLDKLFRRQDVLGVAVDQVAFSSWVIAGTVTPSDKNRWWRKHRVFVHRFVMSEYEGGFHDHPWPYRSLIVSGGYWEVTERGRRWYGPGRMLKRQASWRHRIEIPEGKDCVTIVYAGPREGPGGRWYPAALRSKS